MRSWIVRSIQSGIHLFRNRPRWLRLVTRGLGILLIAAAMYYLLRTVLLGVEQVDLRSLELSPGPVLISLLLTTICSGVGSWAWQLVLQGFGYSVSLRECLEIQTMSNLAKYLPGYAWQLFGKAYLTRKKQVPTAVVTWALFWELVLMLLSGLLVGLAMMPSNAPLPLLGTLSPWLHGILVALILLATISLPLLLRAAGSSHLSQRFSWLIAPRHLRPIWEAVAITVVSWVALGIGLDLLIVALGFTPAEGWGLGVYSLPLSVVVGLLAPFVPGGIGIREGVMAWMLRGHLPSSVAVAVALLSRLVFIAGELGVFILYWLMKMGGKLHNLLITRKD